MILQALSKLFGFGKISTERVDQLIKEAEIRARSMETGHYEDAIKARMQREFEKNRQMQSEARQRNREERVRELSITMVMQQVMQQVISGRVGTESWALRAAFEEAKPKAEAIYDYAQEHMYKNLG